MQARAALLLSTLLCASAALAAPPDTTSNPGDYSRSGFTGPFSAHHILDANTTSMVVQVTNATTVPFPACFGFGTMVVISSDAPVQACWSLTSSATIQSQTTRQANTLDLWDGPGANVWAGEQGGAADGKCSGISLKAGGRWTMIPRFSSWFPPLGRRVAPGRRTGICSASPDAANLVDKPTRPFCWATASAATNGDCTDAGITGGTCSFINTADEQSQAQYNGCAYLVLRATTAANVDINTEN